MRSLALAFFRYSLLMENQMFTKCLIATIDEAALAKFGDYSKFSRQAFANYKNPAGAWRAIRNPRKNGKARALYIEDLLCISKALEIQLSELFFRVEQNLKLGWMPKSEPNETIRSNAAKNKPSKKGETLPEPDYKKEGVA